MPGMQLQIEARTLHSRLSKSIADLLAANAGCSVLSLDNYNDASRLIDGNFDGKFIDLCYAYV